MALSKDRLIFDAADLAESDNIGAYLRAGSDGDLISSTNVGGKEGIDVNVISTSMVVSATDLDIRDLAFATDKVDVSGSEVSLNAATLAALENISAIVTATDLDIRDLSHSQDSIKIGDGTDFLAVNADGSINVVADLSVVNSFEKAEDAAHLSGDIGGYMLGVIQAVPAADAADGDYGSIKTDALGRAWVNAGPNVSQVQGNVTVGATEVALPASALANRRKIIVQNTAANDIYVGPTGVLTTTGLRVGKGATLEMEVGPSLALFAIAAGAGNAVRVWELA